MAEDIGNALTCGAHLTALRRVAIGPLSISDAVTLDQLSLLSEDDRASWLLAPDTLLQSLPDVHLDDEAALRFSHGNPVNIAGNIKVAQGKCRVYGATRLLGLGEADGLGGVKPRRLVCA